MIYIILPIHNRIKVTQKFLDCLKVQNYSDFKLLIVDDGSTDNSSEVILSQFPESILIKGDGSLWWGGSLHVAYKYLVQSKLLKNADICFICNDDVTFDAEFFETGVKLISHKERTLILASCYDDKELNLIDTGIYVDWFKFTFISTNDPHIINCLSTRGLFIRANDYIQLGGFYPVLLPHYGSDYEYTIRAWNKGYHLISEPSLKLYLDQGQTGFHEIKEKSLQAYFKKYFSKKNPQNPFYLIMFIILSAPVKFWGIAILRVLNRSIKQISEVLAAR